MIMERPSEIDRHHLMKPHWDNTISRTEVLELSDFKGGKHKGSTSSLFNDDNLLDDEKESKEHLNPSEEPSQCSLFGSNVIDRHPPSGIPSDYEKTMWCHSAIYKAIRSLFILSKRPLVQRRTVRGFLGLYLERYRHLSTYPWIIYPLSDFCWCWTIILIVGLMGTLTYEPLRISFFSEEYTAASSWDVTVSCVTSDILLFDILLTFITGYEGKSSLFVILEPTVIARNYFKSWFFFDLFTRLPLDVILFYSYTFIGQEVNLKWVRILGMGKILRVLTLNRLITKFLKCFELSELGIRMVKLFLLFFFVIHWFACFHWFLPHLSAETLQIENGKNSSWITQFSLWKESKSSQYLNSLLRSVSTVFVVNEGNGLVRTEEMLCTIISSVVGLTLYGFAIVLFAVHDSCSHRAEQVYNEMMVCLEEYLHFRKVPGNLRERIYTYYDSKFCGHYFPESQILETLSDNLRTEIKVFNCRRLVYRVPMFENVPGNIIKDIIKRLVYEVYVPGDLVVTCGREGNCMYFVQIGTLQVLTSTGKIVGEIQDGNFFGEISLVTNEKRMATVVAKTRCETYRLSRDDFRNCVQGYPEVYEGILQVAKHRVGIEHHAAAINRNIHGEENFPDALAEFLKLEQNDKQMDQNNKLYGNENTSQVSTATSRNPPSTGVFQEILTAPASVTKKRGHGNLNAFPPPAKTTSIYSGGNKNKQEQENEHVNRKQK